MADAFPFPKRTAGGVTVTLRVQLRAWHSTLASGIGTLEVGVDAPPIDGRANDVVIVPLARRLSNCNRLDGPSVQADVPGTTHFRPNGTEAAHAETWSVPNAAFGIVQGTTSGSMTMAIAGAPDAIAERISAWAASIG